ncbi:hypothetical protein [Streptomyces sp. NPDC048445]|uniref:hypothetical protein n=1 Tax=Streptomyces sp. NPDC048445 TaxID=3365553 RepID=UPI003710EB97
MTGDKWDRPEAGRERAATALLAWLADPDAPRLCLVSGRERCGKSTLLAWLVGHGTRPGTLPARRVHVFFPLEGQSVRGTVWALADQLGVVARSPAELVEALSADKRRTVLVLPGLDTSVDPATLTDLVRALSGLEHLRLLVETRSGGDTLASLNSGEVAVMDLDDSQWTDSAREAVSQAAHTAPRRSPGLLTGTVADLDDPWAICSADPWEVTTIFENSTDSHGGLRAAWLRAGQSLCREQDAAGRALTLWASLGDSADPRVGVELARLASPSAWAVEWARTRGDISPPWPGPGLALAVGRGQLSGQIILADHGGTLRAIAERGATATGRLPQPVPETRAVACLASGEVWVLDGRGQLCMQKWGLTPRSSAIAALLDEPQPAKRAAGALTAHLADTPGTALAASDEAVAVGDAAGAVHTFALTADGAGAKRRAHLHTARVTALAALEIPIDGSPDTTALVYSGGADGTVRAWAPALEPDPAAVTARPHAVRAVSAAYTNAGVVLAVAWADGLVELRHVDAGESRAFRPGPPVNALALTRDERLVIGMDASVVCLRPR